MQYGEPLTRCLVPASPVLPACPAEAPGRVAVGLRASEYSRPRKEQTGMRLHPARFLALGAAAAMTASALAGCGGAATAQNGSSPDILVGISLPLTGNFSSDGQAFMKGYELWQGDVTRHG